MKFRDAEIALVDPHEEFEEQFVGVLGRLPSTAADALTQFWSLRRKSGLRFTNTISLPEKMPLNAFGVTFDCGRTLKFRRDIFCATERQFSSDVIAHELAHVYDWAVGDASKIEKGRQVLPAEEFQMEVDAVRIASSWGFDLPGNGPVEQHLKTTAERIRGGLPLDAEHDQSRLLLAQAIQMGSKIVCWSVAARGSRNQVSIGSNAEKE